MRIYELMNEELGEGILSRIGSKIGSNRVSRGLGSAKTAVTGAGGAVLAGASDAVGLLTKAGLWFPFKEYLDNMETAEQWLEYEGNTPEAQKKYHSTQQEQLGILISTFAAALVGSSIIKSFPVLFGFLGKLPIIGKPIALLMGGLSGAAQLYFMKELVSDEGRKALAGLISVGILKNIGEVGLEAWPFMKDVFAKAMGMASDTASDLSATGHEIANDPSKLINQQHNPEVFKDKPKDSESKKTDVFDKQAAAEVAKLLDKEKSAASYSGDDYAPPGMKRDASGKLVISTD